MNLEDLERKIQRLEDIEAIKKLKARYCQCADEQDADGFANLFVEHGVFDGGTFGRSRGREEISKFLRGVQQQMLPFALHYVMNPSIEVEGEKATGQWYLLEPCTMMVESNQAVWGTARYEEEYVKVGGEWRFKTVKLIPVFWTPFDQGWVKKRFVQE
jgi:uncharacterized protein (TIGR02246 family)